MTRLKIFLLIVIGLLPLVLVSCWGGAQPAGGWSGTAIEGGVIYAGLRDGRVVAVNSSSRDLLWSFGIATTSGGGLSCGPTSVPTAIYTTPIVDNDLAYVGTYSGQVLALSTMARSQNLTFPQQRYGEWEWDCPKDGAKSNAIVANLVVNEDALYVASSNGRVYCLDKGTGDENWNREDIPVLAEKLWRSPVVQGDTLYISTFDGRIYGLSAETGKLSDWSFEAETGFASSPAIEEDSLFLGSFDRYLYAIVTGGNASMWRFPEEEPAGNWFWASPVASEGVVYAGCLDGRLYAIEAQTGERLWRFDAGSPIVSSPVLMDNLLLVTDESGTLYVFDLAAELADEAEPLKAISIGTVVKNSFCAQDGLAYIRGEDNSIYVVDIDKGEVVEGWPVSLASEE
jgi:outer membrane protein assembly factor BamB